MKTLLKTGLYIASLLLVLVPVTVNAYTSVKGYTNSKGTYVAPYVRSSPNGLKYDNYGYKPSQGLYNPSYGTKGAAWDTPTYITDPNYYQGKALYDANHTGTTYTSGYAPSYTQPSTVAAPSNSFTSGGSWYCNSGYKTIYSGSQKAGCEQVIAPPNAFVSGSDWYCNSGYKTIYSGSQKVSCEQVMAPPNAFISGSDWHCNSGYKTVYNGSQKLSCQQVIAPANAFISGSDWYCNSGYKTIYNGSQKTSCEQVIAPPNAFVSGSDWYCNSGYKTVYNNYTKLSCEPK